MSERFDCVVIGAGIAGVMAARRLADRGFGVVTLDKGRGVGGRMATRRIEEYRFDHGAQSVVFTDKRLIGLAETWARDGIVRPFGYRSSADSLPAEYGPISGAGGINSIPKRLLSGLNVRSGCRVSRATRRGSLWVAQIEGGEEISCDAVIMTPPVPQAIEIVRQGGVSLPEGVAERLGKIEYERCIAVMAVYETQEPLLSSGFVKPGEGPVALVIDNFAKGVSPEPGAITLHGDPEFSLKFWDEPEEKITAEMLNSVESLLSGEVRSATVHRWRYSRTVRSHPETFELIESPGLMAFAGDGFAGKDIEGAALSGMAAAEAVIDRWI